MKGGNLRDAKSNAKQCPILLRFALNPWKGVGGALRQNAKNTNTLKELKQEAEG